MSRLTKIMMHQRKAAIKADHPNLMVHMDGSDVKRWFFMVVNLPGPYAGGEYIFRLTAPDTFPRKPPVFEFLTPNGVFDLGGKICISIGEFHSSDKPGKTGAYGWRSSLGMLGFAREVVNGMIEPEYLGGGIRVRNDPAATKARHAARSRDYNRENHPDLVSRFREYEEAWPGHKAVRAKAMWGAVTAVAARDFAAAPLEDLATAFADAFGAELWETLSESLGYAAQIPDLPVEQLIPMGFRVCGRDLIVRMGDRVREALTEREAPIRRALAAVLHARVLWEIADGAPAGVAGWCEWVSRFRVAYAAFLDHLPNVCGGACRESVPDAMAAVGAAPAALPQLHAALSQFLRAPDIDEKARLGKAFAARAAVAAAEAPRLEEAAAAAPPGGDSAAPVETPPGEAPPGGDSAAPVETPPGGDSALPGGDSALPGGDSAAPVETPPGEDDADSLDDYVAGLLDDL